MADNTKPLAQPGSANQGSYNTYVQGLTTQTGQQQPSNPVADARAKLQAQQTGNGTGLVRKLFGFAGGTREVPGWAGSSDRAFDDTKQDFSAGNYARAAGDAVRGVAMLPISRLATIGNTIGDTVLPRISDFAQGLVNQVPGAAPAAPAPAPVAAAAPRPHAPVGAVAGNAVAPQPSMPAPLNPRSHSMEQFLKATDGMTWGQAAQLLAWAPPDMRSPPMQAQARLNSLTDLAVRNSLQGYKEAAGAGKGDLAARMLNDAIARAQNATGGGIGSINPLISARMRQGMVAE